MVVLLHGKSAGKVRMPAEAEAAMTNVTTVERPYAGQTRECPRSTSGDAGRRWAQQKPRLPFGSPKPLSPSSLGNGEWAQMVPATSRRRFSEAQMPAVA